uniref:Peptidase M12A domain-containing protein n=1 Tax=Parastrongyloides trichosuri TaxID=131310 RepID=A0A0N4ZED0_PARTI
VNCESSKTLESGWKVPVNVTFTGELTDEGEATFKKALENIQNKTCITFKKQPEPPMDANVNGLPPRLGLFFGVNRYDDEPCGTTPSGGDEYFPYTSVDIRLEHHKDVSEAEECIYKALGITENYSLC